jgi:Ca2+-binding EF-hand superfamily protein
MSSGSRVDFASFLELLHEHAQSGDPLVEIMAAFRCIDKHRTGLISVGEFAAILSSIGEKMSRSEIEAVIRQLGVAGNRLPYEKLVRLLATQPPDY